MNILYYPDRDDIENTGSMLKKIMKRPDLWALTRETLKKVEKSSNLDFLIKTDWVGKLSHCKHPIFEFKIPPQKKGGVVRLYFGYVKNDSNTIIILSAELKKRTSPDSQKVSDAEKRYLEVCI